MTKELILSQGKVALVDDEDFDWLNQWKWCVMRRKKTFYVVRSARSHSKMAYLHRVILNAPKGMEVDHINGDGLDNRRSNLRLATRAENGRNRHMQVNNKSGYKGVSWYKQYGRWRTTIKVSGKTLNLGYFDLPEIAALAYDEAARGYFGEFAKTNFQ